MATVKAVKLPRYVMFKGDNGNNLCHWEYTHIWLQFNTTKRELWGAHEVIPVHVPGQENVVMIKSMYNQRYWRISPSWIWADQSEKPKTDNLDCLFKVVYIGQQTVALQCLANKRYLTRLSTDGWESCLNASATDYRNNRSAQLEVSEALSERHVFNVQYLMEQLQTNKDVKPFVLGKAATTNESHFKTDLAVTVEYSVDSSATWSNSTTLTTGLSVTLTAGIPDVSSASVTASSELSNTIEFGKAKGKSNKVTSTCTVKDVPPGDEVQVTVSGTRASGTVPYKYKFQEKLVDGTLMEVENGVDGIFTGVQVVDIKWVATDSRGTKKQAIVTKKSDG